VAAFSTMQVKAQDVLPAPAITDVAAASAESRDLYLEVFVNDVSTGLIGAFKQLPDGGLASTPEELREVGLEPVESAMGSDHLVRVDRLPDVSYRIDEATQRLYVTATDAARSK